MRNSIRLAMSLMTLASLASCKKEGAESDDSEFKAADSTAVAASSAKWVATQLAADYAGWGTTVTSDVVLFPPNTAPVIGRDAAVAFVKAYPKMLAFTATSEEITGRGDVAYDRGTYTTTVQLPDGKTASDKGSFLAIFRRQPDGTWEHSRVSWNSNLPVPPAAPAPPKAKGK